MAHFASVRDIIDGCLGGTSRVAEWLGVAKQTVSGWKHPDCNSIPPHWADAIRDALWEIDEDHTVDSTILGQVYPKSLLLLRLSGRGQGQTAREAVMNDRPQPPATLPPMSAEHRKRLEWFAGARSEIIMQMSVEDHNHPQYRKAEKALDSWYEHMVDLYAEEWAAR
jgi:hypothetical protein